MQNNLQKSLFAQRIAPYFSNPQVMTIADVETTKDKLVPKGIREVRDAIKAAVDMEKVVGVIIEELREIYRNLQKPRISEDFAEGISQKYKIPMSASEIRSEDFDTIAHLIYQKIRETL